MIRDSFEEAASERGLKARQPRGLKADQTPNLPVLDVFAAVGFLAPPGSDPARTARTGRNRRPVRLSLHGLTALSLPGPRPPWRLKGNPASPSLSLHWKEGPPRRCCCIHSRWHRRFRPQRCCLPACLRLPASTSAGAWEKSTAFPPCPPLSLELGGALRGGALDGRD